MQYKALILDVDGTLVPNKEDGMPSKKVIHAIKKAQTKIPIGIATARSYWQVAYILDLIPFSAPCIITGGAQIINPKTRKTFIEYAPSIAELLIVANIGKSLGISFIVVDRNGIRPFAKDSLPEKPLNIYTNAIPVQKADEFIKKISHMSTIKTHKTLTWVDSKTVHITVSSPEASKQEGVVEVARILKITPADIIGVGEGYNDYGLLMACGFRVAMGNAVDEVKAIADVIVPPVEEDGVVDVIEKYILQ